VTIGCLLYTPGEKPACRALQFWGVPPLAPETLEDLEHQYCSTGAFINCPVFRFVQERLEAMRRVTSPAEIGRAPRSP
jgi:hypothetical protein